MPLSFIWLVQEVAVLIAVRIAQQLVTPKFCEVFTAFMGTCGLIVRVNPDHLSV